MSRWGPYIVIYQQACINMHRMDIKAKSYLSLLSVCLCLSLGACAAPSTQERTIHQGGAEVHKACTERPPATYSAGVEARLKAALPLQEKTEAEAEGAIKAHLEQQAGGTKIGEDLQSYLFYLCQMANNGGWRPETTERLIKLFMDKWPQNKQESNASSPKCVRQLESGYALKDKIDSEYWSSRKSGIFQDRREEFTAGWDREAGQWGATTEAVLLELGGPIAKGKFRNAVIPATALDNTNTKWNGIRNFLQGRLLALESICKNL